MKADFHNLDLLLNTAVSKIVQQPSANSKPNPSSQMEHPQPAHVHPPPPSAHHQLPPQFEQSDSLPLDLFIKSTTTPRELTPPNPKLIDAKHDSDDKEDVLKPKINNEKLDDDDLPSVVIDGVHDDDMSDFESPDPYCPQNITTPKSKH